MKRVVIEETPYGWRAGAPGHVGEFYETAGAALAALKAEAAVRAQENGGADVLVIEWNPTTSIGASVVAALQ